MIFGELESTHVLAPPGPTRTKEEPVLQVSCFPIQRKALVFNIPGGTVQRDIFSLLGCQCMQHTSKCMWRHAHGFCHADLFAVDATRIGKNQAFCYREI